MVRRFLASGRTGFYFAVVREGELALATRSKSLLETRSCPCSDVTRLYIAKRYGTDEVSSSSVPRGQGSAPELEAYFQQRLQEVGRG